MLPFLSCNMCVSRLKFLLSIKFCFPTENGKFLALDLGGTNFRVILLELDHGEIKQEIVKKYHIHSELRVGDASVATALFDHIGECLCDFVAENDLVSVSLALGT